MCLLAHLNYLYKILYERTQARCLLLVQIILTSGRELHFSFDVKCIHRKMRINWLTIESCHFDEK